MSGSSPVGRAGPPPVLPPDLASEGGLTSDEARRLLEELGPNRPPAQPRRSLAARAGEQLRDPMILLLQVAAVLSGLLREWPSMAIIVAVVVFNTTTGLVQQSRADRVMSALNELMTPTSLVRRDGVLTTVSAHDLVQGDEIVLATGDLVPADAEVVAGHALELDEAPLTGESLPVPHVRGDEISAGTRVTHGRAVAHVTRTGAGSGLGRIAAMIAGAGSRPTPLQVRLTRLSRALVVLVVALTVVVVALGVLQGRPWWDMVLVGLSLTVAAVPESLPAVVTVALALGAHRMAQRHVVVRALPAVETLGSVTILATDKTGTLTEGRMVVQALEGAGPGDAADRLLVDLALCNDAEPVLDGSGERVVAGDPLDGALLAAAERHGVDVQAVRAAWPRTRELPFSAATRTMTTWHSGRDGLTRVVVKGAPEVVLGMITDPEAERERAMADADALAGRGLRVIAVAERGGSEAGWRLAGLVGIGDAVRASAPTVVERLRRAGIRLVLVTGDHAGTAAAVAREVGIATEDSLVVEGHALASDQPAPVGELTVVARVLPEQKVHVVRRLQEADEVVAMLGDGVNDAPALRQADIGVAAGGTGSEVAKEAADLVLTDDELSSVVAAVEEGRRIYANIRSFLLYAVSGGLAEVGVMVSGTLVGLVVPLLPGQILWINLLTHGLVGVAFGSQPLDQAEMERPPRPMTEPIFTRSALQRLAAVTLALVVSSLVVCQLTAGTDDVRRTALFLALGGGQLGVALALRTPRRQGGLLRGRGVEVSVSLAVVLLVAAAGLSPLQGLLQTELPAITDAPWILAAALVPGVLLRIVRRTGGGG